VAFRMRNLQHLSLDNRQRYAPENERLVVLRRSILEAKGRKMTRYSDPSMEEKASSSIKKNRDGETEFNN
jgi:hypothetical protein